MKPGLKDNQQAGYI